MARVSRRKFFKGAGMVGAGAAAASAIPLSSAKAQVAQPMNMAGKVSIIPTPAAVIHTYTAPVDSVGVTTHIIETANNLVVVDTQLLVPFAAEAAAYAASLGKPIDRVILSHEHRDHWWGAAGFDAPFVATPTTVANVTTVIDDGSELAATANFGPAAPTELRAPVVGISTGVTVIDGLTYDISTVEGAESVEQLVIRIPEANTVIVQDLLYNGMYFFPGLNRLAWINALDELRVSLKSEGYQTVLPGHGVPTTVGLLDEAIEYVAFMEDQFNTQATGEAIVEAVKTRYPSYQGELILMFIPVFFAGGSE